ncbi:MAG: AbgT family transporter [Clostridiales bacterium]|nr:AbgT family transporter [Clostridiales bacterium]
MFKKKEKGQNNVSIEKRPQKVSFIERVGHKIPDPVIIFISLFGIVMLLSLIMGGHTFETLGKDGGTVEVSIKNMFTSENIRWIFENALVKNWLTYGNGILGVILIIMFGIGLSEESGLLSALIRKVGGNLPIKILPYLLVFLGIMSNIASDAGYIVLIPLAGLLYLGIGKNPLIGMCAAFAGVSAGFSANLIPYTVSDIVVGSNAEIFADAQGVPFVSYIGRDLNGTSMNYYFIVASTFLLVLVGGFITNKFTKRKFENAAYTVPEDIDVSNYKITAEEKKALRWSGIGLLISIGILVGLAFGPLKPYVNADGKTIKPFVDNIILLITFVFFTCGLFYGVAIGKFKKTKDIVHAMSKQVGGMGYIIVLTFFSYNFLALLNYTQFGTYITYLGAEALKALGLAGSPALLIIGFIIITSLINLFVGGLTSKWMLLGPIFIPMLYHANPNMTPDVVGAAYRIADSSTNIITPLMSYAGVVLVYMKKYKEDFSVGHLISAMMPYSIAFLISWIGLLFLFLGLKLPLGF